MRCFILGLFFSFVIVHNCHAQKADNTSAPTNLNTGLDKYLPLFKQNNDSTYILLFWAEWCGPCNHILISLEKVKASLKKGPYKFVVLHALRPENTIKAQEYIEQGKAFLKGRNNDFNYLSFSWATDKLSFDEQSLEAIPVLMLYKNSKPFFIRVGAQWGNQEVMSQTVKDAILKATP